MFIFDFLELVLVVCLSVGETVQAGGQLDPNSAVSFYVAGMDLTQWSTVEIAFRTELAFQANTFCAHSLEECNINASHSLSVTADDVLFLTGFPVEVENNLRVVVGVSLSVEQALSPPAFIPQAQLMNVLLINQATLQTAVGSFIAQFTLYYEEPLPSPSPSAVPSAPTLDILIENAILVIVDQISLTSWLDGDLEMLFREAVAEVANDYCSLNPASCNIDTSVAKRRKRTEDEGDVIFNENSTYIIPDYPQGVGDTQIEVAFAVSLPLTVPLLAGTTEYFIPQQTLLSVGLELSPVLAELSGAYIIGISAYQPTEAPTTVSKLLLIGAGIVVPLLLIALIILCVAIAVPLIWIRGKRRTEIFDVDNYVRAESKNVKMLSYRRLQGHGLPQRHRQTKRATGSGAAYRSKRRDWSANVNIEMQSCRRAQEAATRTETVLGCEESETESRYSETMRLLRSS